MTLARRLERLEQRAPRPAPRPPLSPERFEALMRKLEAVGLAAWSADHQRWYPPEPRLLRQVLRERRERGHAVAE